MPPCVSGGVAASGQASRTVDIAMVGPYPRDPQHIAGGIEASTYGLAQALTDRPKVGRITVFAVPVSGDLRAAPVRGCEGTRLHVHYLRARYRLRSSMVLAAPDVLRAIRENGPDLAHVHGTGLLQAAVLGGLKLAAVPVVWTLHGIAAKETWDRFKAERSWRAGATWLYYSVLERWCRFAADQVLVDTPYVAQELGSASDVAVVPQGVTGDAYQEDSPIPGTVVSVGVLQWRKGHDLLIRAFAKVVRAIPSASLTILGGNADTAYVDELSRLIADLGLEDRVTLVEEAQRSQVLGALRTAAVFATHSREESQGIAVCEAMASGKPVVATRVGGLRDVVTEEAGFLEDLGDIDAFARRVTLLLEDADLRARTSQAARARAELYRWPRIADDVLDVYTRTVERSRPRGMWRRRRRSGTPVS
jgi:glycosyltransferase involved in cell wall biosynthesis